MANIDKIYATSYKDFIEFYDWCNQFSNLCKKETNYNILDWFYYTPKEVEEAFGKEGYHMYGFPITNFPCIIDNWLLRRCPITWIREYLIYSQHVKKPKLKDIELVSLKPF